MLTAAISGCSCNDSGDDDTTGSKASGTSTQTLPNGREGGDGAEGRAGGGSSAVGQALDPATKRAQARQLRKKRKELQREGKDPSRVRPLPNGDVVVIGPKPDRTSVSPSDGCAENQVDRDGHLVTVTVPPPPGLRAEFDEGTVKVAFDPGRPPSNCRPDFVSILVGKDAGRYPLIRSDVQIRELRKYLVQVPLPDTHGTPDVATAVAGIKGGGSSPPAVVRITR
jgi:hypothetical protein